MKGPTKAGLSALLVCCLGVGLIFWVKRQRPPPPTGQPGTIWSENAVREQLRTTAGALAGQPDRVAAGRLLAELREGLSRLPRPAAAALIQEFIEQGMDAKTGLEFKVGANGFLDSAPSLRVFLLDQLAQTDREAAARLARKILDALDSPDEWAVCLRNVALGEASPETRALLEAKLVHLLGYKPWQENPSTGYLEAFDVAVFLGGTGLVPILSELVCGKDNPAVAHAAGLALDRLVVQDPALVLGFLEASPESLKGRELLRADLFARGDVRDPRQRLVLENYLLRPGVGAAELGQFASVYPNANYRISLNLLTKTATPDFAALRSRDAMALRVAQEWQADRRFEALKPHLERIIRRLEDFVRQAGPSR